MGRVKTFYIIQSLVEVVILLAAPVNILPPISFRVIEVVVDFFVKAFKFFVKYSKSLWVALKK